MNFIKEDFFYDGMGGLYYRTVAALLVAYAALATPSLAEETPPASSSASRLSSTLERTRAGIKKEDGKYHLDTTIVLSNAGKPINKRFFLGYSLCFGPTEERRDLDKHVRPVCVGGGSVPVHKLGRGESTRKDLHLVARMSGFQSAEGEDLVSIIGLTPHVTVSASGNSYSHNHFLKPIGAAYPVEKPTTRPGTQ